MSESSKSQQRRTAIQRGSDRVTYYLTVETDVDHAPEVSAYLLQVREVLEGSHFGSEVKVHVAGVMDPPPFGNDDVARMGGGS